MPRQTTPPRLPVVSFVIAGLAIVGMVVWSIMQWPAMEPSIVTREAAGNHGMSTVPRLVTACAMPVTLAVLAVLFGFAPRIDGRFLKLLGDPGTARMQDKTTAPRVLGLLLIGLSALFATVHVVLVSLHTAESLPIESLIATAVGAVLILLGIALPLIQPQAVTESETEARFRATQRRAYRRAVPLIMLGIGVVTIVAAWLAPAVAMLIAIGGVLLVFVGGGAFALIRSRAA